MWREIALLACLGLCASAQDAISNATSGPWTAELNGIWRWHEGDDLRWASPTFDDSNWPHLTIPGKSPTMFHYWIRIPVIVGEVPDPGLLLGPIAYAYELYWDGERIGQLGHGPPRAQWFAVRPLVFSVPIRLAASGGHVIAIRVLDGREQVGMRPAQISAGENLVGSLSTLNDIYVALWSRSFQPRLLTYFIDFILVLTGLFFVFLPRSIAGGLAFRWFGACLFSRGISALCGAFEHFGPPVISAGILNRIGLCFFALNFIFAIDFAYAMFRRPVPKPVRGIQALNVAAILVVQLDPISLYTGFLTVAASTAVVLSMIGAALAAIQFRKRSPGASITFALFTVWVLVCSSYLLNNIFHLPTPIWIQVSGFTVRMLPAAQATGFGLALYEAALFVWIPPIAVQILRLNQRFQGERERLLGEMEAARHVQQVLLPAREIHVPGFQIDATYQPATEVGGDFFQLFPVSGDALLILFGDVSGKGMKAALLVSVIVGALQNRSSDQPAEVLRELNTVLLGRSEGGFTTCCCALFGPDGTLTIANAGHLAPYRNGSEIETSPALPLGVVREATWEEARIELQPNDRMLWISDGVVEARNGKRDLLGFERAQELAIQSASDIARAAQHFGQDDDITVVSITRQPVAANVA